MAVFLPIKHDRRKNQEQKLVDVHRRLEALLNLKSVQAGTWLLGFHISST